MTTTEFNQSVQNEINHIMQEADRRNAIKSIKEKFADKRYTSCYVVYDFVVKKYITVNSTRTENVDLARAFSYSGAQDYICSRMHPEFLEIIKYTPDTDTDSEILQPFSENPNPIEKSLEDRFEAMKGK